MVAQRSVILLLMLMVVFVGCGEEEPDKVKSKEVVDEGPRKRIIWEKDGAKMALIPTGSFEMGSNVEFGDPVPSKAVKVLDPFYMDTTEVTVGRFKRFLKSSGYEPKKPIDWAELYKTSPTDDHPMIYVSWFDATSYAEWAGKRLPTEAEWEFAAREGLVDKEFPWGDDESVARKYANFWGTDGKDQWGETTAPVGSFRPNGYGLYDMAGNVWEWCQDWYDSDHDRRVLRGGSWTNYENFPRVIFRNELNPSNANSIINGFRCVSGFPAAQQ